MKLKKIIFLLIFLLASSAHADDKISITCSLFPVYDFAQAVAGDLADVHLILRPGVEPHGFEPSPLDVKILNDSDVFIFTGKFMEEWAEKISRSLDGVVIVEASAGIEIVNKDPHIWLDLSKAKSMVMNIAESLAKFKPEHEKIFYGNAENYCRKLSELDGKFMSLDKKTLIFAGEFAFNYFMRRYGFDCISAYDGENEPSVKSMAGILKYINENRVKYIFSPPVISSVTRSISEQTGTEILIFNSAETIFEDEDNFLEVMQENLEALKKFIDD